MKDNVHITRVVILYKLSLPIKENTRRSEIQDNFFVGGDVILAAGLT